MYCFFIAGKSIFHPGHWHFVILTKKIQCWHSAISTMYLCSTSRNSCCFSSWQWETHCTFFFVSSTLNTRDHIQTSKHAEYRKREADICMLLMPYCLFTDTAYQFPWFSPLMLVNFGHVLFLSETNCSSRFSAWILFGIIFQPNENLENVPEMFFCLCLLKH